MANILVISPHPDDESIGCGGVLARHSHLGDVVHVAFLTSGEKGGHGLPEADTKRIREQEARDAALILNIQQVEFWGAPDGAFRDSRQWRQALSRKIAEFKPEILYVPHEGEMHPDHRAAARMVRSVAREPGQNKPRVLTYEVWTPLQTMDVVVDITAFIDQKLRAIDKYRTQCAQVDFVEAARGLSRYRGEMHSWPEGDYAEVFKILEL